MKITTAHRIIEVKFDKSGTVLLGTGMNTGVRLLAYDASNAAQGELMWPPNSQRDVTTTYGSCEAQLSGTIPLGLTVGVMVLMSSVAVVVGSRYFRKQSRIRS